MNKNHDKTTTSTTTTFDTLLQAFKDAYTTKGSKGCGQELYDLGIAITYSVLNTAIDPQRRASAKIAREGGQQAQVTSTYFNPRLLSIKSSISQDMDNISRLAYTLNNAYATKRNKKGDLVTKVVDSDLAKSVKRLLSYTLGEGMDNVHECISAILDQAGKHGGDLQVEFTARRLDKRVLIRSTDSPKWKDVTTTPIQEVYRHTSNYIRKNPNLCINGYSYLQEVVKDSTSDNGALEIIYRRMKKYADLGEYDSSTELYSIGAQDVERRNKWVAELNLTKLQLQVLELRESGKGQNQISDSLGVSENSVKSAVREIRRKSKEIGLDNDPRVRRGYIEKVVKQDAKRDERFSFTIPATSPAPTPYSTPVKYWFND